MYQFSREICILKNIFHKFFVCFLFIITLVCLDPKNNQKFSCRQFADIDDIEVVSRDDQVVKYTSFFLVLSHILMVAIFFPVVIFFPSYENLFSAVADKYSDDLQEEEYQQFAKKIDVLP